MNEEQFDSLGFDITEWLFSLPSREEIEYYVRHLEDQDGVVGMAAERAIRRLLGEKYEYATAHGYDAFVKHVPEAVQQEYLFNFTQYSALSVHANLAKQYPELVLQVPPADISAWAASFLERWDTVCDFGSCPSYLGVAVYVPSLLRSKLSPEVFSSIATILPSLVTEAAALIKVGAPDLANDQKQREKGFLSSFQIFPPEYVDQLLEPSGLVGRLILYRQLMHVVTVLQSAGYPVTTWEPERVLSALWDIERDDASIGITANLESSRLAELGSDSKEWFVFLAHTVIPAKILDDSLVPAILEYANAIPQERKNQFFEDLILFMQRSPVVDTLIAPLDPDLLMPRLVDAARRRQGATILGEVVGEIDEEFRPVAAKLLKQIVSIYQPS